MAFGIAFSGGSFQNRDAIRQIKRRAEAVRQTGFHPFTHHNPIDHYVNVMAKFLVESWWLIQIIEFTINFHPLKPLLTQLHELFAVFSFAVADDGRKQITTGALLHGHHPVYHILYLLRLNGQACGRGERRTDARE